jgi:hypothetical protein
MTEEHKETYNKLDRYAALGEEIRNEILDRIKTVVESDPDYANDYYDLLKQSEIEFLERLSTCIVDRKRAEQIKTELYKFDKLRP